MNPKNRKDLITKIKEYRMNLGYTQEELAHMIGYKSKSTIQKIEKGENDIPQSKIYAFAKALDVTPSELINDEDIEEIAEYYRNATDFLVKELSVADKLQIVLNEDEVIGDYKFSDDDLLDILKYARYVKERE